MPWFDSYLQFPWRKPSEPAIKQDDNIIKQPIQRNRPNNSYKPPSHINEEGAEAIKPHRTDSPAGIVPFSVSGAKLEDEKRKVTKDGKVIGLPQDGIRNIITVVRSSSYIRLNSSVPWIRSVLTGSASDPAPLKTHKFTPSLSISPFPPPQQAYKYSINYQTGIHLFHWHHFVSFDLVSLLVIQKQPFSAQTSRHPIYTSSPPVPGTFIAPQSTKMTRFSNYAPSSAIKQEDVKEKHADPHTKQAYVGRSIEQEDTDRRIRQAYVDWRTKQGPVIKRELDIMQNHVEQQALKLRLQLAEAIGQQRPARCTGYDWEDATRTANEKARSEGITELPASRVARVMEDGKIVCLFDTNPDRKREFIAYDGFDVLACTQQTSSIHGILYELASLHVAKKAGSEHPDKIDLVTTSRKMKDNEGSFCGWAVLFQPSELPGKKRTLALSG
ncbi:hypothetical protein PG984_007069 [Apiospora sp. TS-2023a]